MAALCSPQTPLSLISATLLKCRISPQSGSLGASCLGTVSSGVTLEVNPGHASDCCLIFLSSNEFVLLLDVLLRQCSMEKGPRAFSFSKD